MSVCICTLHFQQLKGFNLTIRCNLVSYQSFSRRNCGPEYTECVSTEGYDSTNECHGYDIKQSDGEAPVILEL